MTTRQRLAVLLATGLLVGGCAQGGNEVDLRIDDVETAEGAEQPTEEQTSGEADLPTIETNGLPDITGVAAQGLETPWGIDFLPDGRGVVTERDSGRVLIIEAPTDGEAAEPIEAGTVPRVRPRAEGGLLGVAVSPTFADDHLLYFYLTTRNDNRVVRASLEDDALGRPEVVLKGIPTAEFHNGGALLFSDDGNLFVATGDATDAALAQDRQSLAGKILRITPDGKRPRGNPFRGSLAWSIGHRNVEGLTFDRDGNLWASEFGLDTADEINLIERGNNYGWPRWEGPIEIAPGAPGPDDPADPAETLAPQHASWAGIAYSQGFLWTAALQGERLWRIKASDGTASDPRDFLNEEYGRLRALTVAPDGHLWLGTSNHDGRGEPGPGDDQILVINP